MTASTSLLLARGALLGGNPDARLAPVGIVSDWRATTQDLPRKPDLLAARVLDHPLDLQQERVLHAPPGCAGQSRIGSFRVQALRILRNREGSVMSTPLKAIRAVEAGYEKGSEEAIEASESLVYALGGSGQRDAPSALRELSRKAPPQRARGRRASVLGLFIHLH